jgi:hypothetical protein
MVMTSVRGSRHRSEPGAIRERVGGGFLGIGEKDVASPLDQLNPGEEKSYLLSTATEEQLEQMPAYEEGQYQSLSQQQQ